MTVHALLWVDLETTGLHPQSDKILEVAWHLTTFKFPRTVLNSGHMLIRWYRPTDVLNLPDAVQEMHTKSGLLAELADPAVPAASGLSRLAIELMTLSSGWDPKDAEKRVVIAGSSAHFDLSFLRAQMPEFARRLSHRVYDVSSLAMQCQALGMPPLPAVESQHRAKVDILQSIEHEKACVRWLSTLSYDSRLLDTLTDTPAGTRTDD